jgi:hypothetical protein
MDDTFLNACLQRLPKGWFRSSEDIAEDMQRQLHVELTDGHVLDGIAVRVVAHRMGTDDILCWHPHEPLRFTVVHLSWGGKGYDSLHPTVESDGTFDDFLKYESKWDRGYE